jgi:hypothetical protein
MPKAHVRFVIDTIMEDDGSVSPPPLLSQPSVSGLGAAIEAYCFYPRLHTTQGHAAAEVDNVSAGVRLRDLKYRVEVLGPVA